MFPSPFARLFGMVSAPFDNEQYRNQGDKATGKPNSYQKVIICAGRPLFVYGGAISALPGNALLWLQRCDFCAAGGILFSYSGAIFERSRSPFIDYSGAKYVRSALKIAAAQKALF